MANLELKIFRMQILIDAIFDISFDAHELNQQVHYLPAHSAVLTEDRKHNPVCFDCEE
jgi:hypothetical protein